ncbi:hypothetical protein CROQUDRAFT_705186 [Cronartium quercuum f. sp. fusiforme G11]|uniref:Vacuolar fusion protein MON1 n=1 Tax=Cronartium quercuum f. sp. fusiforme G11 TaxID=708437 RepID=A0A9P6NGT0_9BASI|nr:hypothetical protein CROQUDRAFT_705186 [Cronartium quercuum f. sp. fusiforme G11]
MGAETDDVGLDARKYFILTSAGKPVWSTEEDCDDKEGGDTTGLMGLMQAIISIFEDDGDELRYIDSGAVKIAVMLKPPLFLLAVSNWGEPESILRLHLEYLYLLIQSIVSLSQLHKLFERRQNYDLRRTLTGTESIFRGLVNKLQWDFSIMMSGLEVFSCARATRNTISRILNLEEVARKLLYSIVLIHGKVACLVRPKNHSVHPSDLQLIITTVLSSSSLQNSESWVPICLPGYNSTGFLHAYITFFPSPDSHIGLLFVSGDRNGFFGLKKWAEQIAEHPVWQDVGSQAAGSELNDLKASLSSDSGGGYSLEQVGIPSLRHFVYKHKTHVQVTSPIWEDDYLNMENRRRLVTTYQRAYDLMHPKLSRIKDDPRAPMTFLYLRNEGEGIIAWNTVSHELYMAVSPMMSKAAAVSAAHSVVKWIKSQEDSLFLTSAPAF